MKYKYVVILKKESERATDAFSILLCLFSALTFAWLAVRQVRYTHHENPLFTSASIGAPTDAYILGALSILLLTGLIINLIRRRRTRIAPRPVRYRFWLLIAAIGWIGLTPTPWVGAFFFLLSFLEYQTKRPLEIGFDQDHIVMNTLFKRQFDWSAFNNVILKDGLLTLDFKNDKLIQKMVADDEDEDDADEEEFNTYCRSRLTAVSTNR